MQTILDSWQSEEYVPLFVSEGTKAQKIASIRGSYYLSNRVSGSADFGRHALTLFGWGIGEHDRHLLQRTAQHGHPAGCGIGVPQRSGVLQLCHQTIQDDLRPIQDDLGPIQVDFFDCESPGCWIQPMPEQG
ncbi:DUF4917 family protein [Pseudomonas aeruginosa]|nr:DUF4917 family protein [Pseudomonas aeruginosa]